jgi:hypothetical protein
MYPGTNPVGIATSLNGGAVPSSVFRGVIKFDIALSLQMLINGIWTNLSYPGMIVADAESMNTTPSVTEYISATTTGSTGWQILDIRNDAASIDQDPTKYKLEISNSGSNFKLYNDQVNDMGVQAVMYAQGTTALTDVQMRGRGVTAVQRSANAKSWQDLGSVSAQGESGTLAKYIFSDKAPLEGTNLYRLKMVDKDETFAYSRIRELSYAGGAQETVYPNPVSGTLFIRETAAGTLKEAAIFNLKGQQVYQSNVLGSQQIDVQPMTPGMYIVKTKHANGAVYNHKVVISH